MNQCVLCHRPFDEAELLQSSQDEFFCKECFKYEYCAVSRQKPSVPSNRCEGDVVPARKMFSSADLEVIRQEREATADAVFTSKRPLRCPHMECNRYVSILDFDAHFRREHVEVPVLQSALDVRNPLTFHPKDIRYGVKQCLFLLHVCDDSEDKEEVPMKSQPLPVTVAVLVSRIAAAQLGDDSECHMDEEDLPNNDKIIIWAASNVVSKYSYTVAVSTISEEVRVKYYGPVLQLGHNTKKLCKEGHSLILSHFHFLGMAENGQKPVNLDVIIHSED